MNELVVLQTSQGICKYLEDILGNTEFSVMCGVCCEHTMVVCLAVDHCYVEHRIYHKPDVACRFS